MSIYRRVEIRMFNDREVRSLSRPQPNGESLFVRLLIGPETGIVPGVFEARESGLAEALGWPLEGFRKAFREVSGEAFHEGGRGARKPLAKADWEAGLVWVPGGIKRNPPQAPNVIRSWREAWDILPECDLKIEAYRGLRDFVEGMGEGFVKAFREALPEPSWEPSGKPSANQEQEQEQEQEQNSPQTPQGAGVSEVVPAMPGLWETFDRARASEYLAELGERWPGLSVPAGRMPDAAQGLFAHFAKLEPDDRAAAFQRLAKAYRADRFLPTIVWKFLAESDLTKVANGSAGPAKTAGPAPPAPHSAHGLGEVKF